MTERELFKETFSQLHASPATLSEVMNMAKHENITSIRPVKRSAKRVAALVAVAALLVTGAFAAGSAVYKMHSEPVGEYGLNLMVGFEDAEASVEPGATPILEVTPGWLPEGMALNVGETMKYSYAETPFQGGFSMHFWVLDTGSNTFRQTVLNLESRESITINGHEAEYVTLQNVLEEDGVRYDQRLYIVYPEYNQVLCIYIGEDMDKDTAVKFAENLVFEATGEYYSEDMIDYHAEEYAENHVADVSADSDGKFSATASEMAGLHQIGESFEAREYVDGKWVPLTLKVTDVTVSDDDSGLSGERWENSDLASRLNEDGTAPTNTIRFVKIGDGVNSLDSVVAAKEEATKIVLATFEVTNTTDETLEHIHYYASYLTLEETADGYAIWKPAPEEDVEYDYVSMGKVSGDHRMLYESVADDYGNGGNYIPSLAPGETACVQVGFLVSESELDKLYLNLDGEGVGMAFSDSGLGLGYIDIRQ